MKKQVKQFFAALLCLCMVAAVLPAGTPQASAAGETVTINFGSLSMDSLISSNVTNYVGGTDCATLVPNKGGWFAFDITIPTDGNYSPTMVDYAFAYDCAWSAYIVPADELTAGNEVADIAARLTSDYKVMSATGAQAKAGGTFTGSTVSLRADDYKLIITNDGEGTYLGSNAYTYNKLVSFTLTRTNDYGIEFDLAGKAATGQTPIGPVSLVSDSTTGAGNGIINQNGSGAKEAGSEGDYSNIRTYDENGWVAFDVTIGESATYTPKMQSFKSPSTLVNYSVFLIPESELTSGSEVSQINTMVAAGEHMLGTVTAYSATNGTPTDTFENVPLLKGAYKLVIVNRAYEAGTYKLSYVMNLFLANVGEYVEPTVDPIKIEMKFNSETWTYQGTSLNDFKGNTNYTIDKTATTATVKKVNSGNVAFAIAEDNELVIKFDAEVAGDYKLVIDSAEHSDYGLNAKVLVNGNEVGEIHNDNNVSDAKDYFYNKGFGKVALTEVGNTITIKGLAPDTIKSGNTETPRAGNVNFYVRGITLTQATEEAVAKCVEISGDNTKVTAKVIMSDDGSELTGADIVYGCASDPAGVITVDETTGKIESTGAGRAVVEAEYVDADGVVYQDQMEIAVTNDDIFGNVYAYIEETTGNVVFLGGLKTISGYTKVGFYVFEGTAGNAWDMNMVADDTKALTTSNVYETITTTDGTYDASYFGEECGHIFFVEKNIAAGTTVIVRPFIEDASGNKIIYGKQYTMTVGQ